MARAEVRRWTDLEADHPMPLIDRRRINGVHAMLCEFTLHEGLVVPPHRHENEQFACVLSGRVRFKVEEPDGSFRDEIVTSGQVLHLPPNVAHGAEAIETSVVLDVFSPPSEKTGVDSGS